MNKGMEIAHGKTKVPGGISTTLLRWHPSRTPCDRSRNCDP